MAEDLADVMAGVVRTLHEHQSVEENLDAVVHAVRATVPGVKHAGISIARRDRALAPFRAGGPRDGGAGAAGCRAVQRGERRRRAQPVLGRGRAFGDETVHVVELFATHAAQALGKSMREEQLTEALRSRRQIGQAIGIVMERYRLDEQRALDHLLRVSQQTSTKLRTLAADLVERTDGRRPDPATSPAPVDPTEPHRS